MLLSLCESIFVSGERRNRESFAGAANREFRLRDGRYQNFLRRKTKMGLVPILGKF